MDEKTPRNERLYEPIAIEVVSTRDISKLPPEELKEALDFQKKAEKHLEEMREAREKAAEQKNNEVL